MLILQYRSLIKGFSTQHADDYHPQSEGLFVGGISLAASSMTIITRPLERLNITRMRVFDLTAEGGISTRPMLGGLHHTYTRHVPEREFAFKFEQMCEPARDRETGHPISLAQAVNAAQVGVQLPQCWSPTDKYRIEA